MNCGGFVYCGGCGRRGLTRYQKYFETQDDKINVHQQNQQNRNDGLEKKKDTCHHCGLD